jgi:Domain of unknown function (DUF4288)
MNWYLSKIVYRIICGEGTHKPQFDEQLRLIEAKNEKEAFEKATEIGKQEQDEFYNQQHKLVQWKFINIAELYKLSGLLDGAELYSKIQEPDNADLYIELTNRKAAHIKTNSTHRFLEIL